MQESDYAACGNEEYVHGVSPARAGLLTKDPRDVLDSIT